MFDQFLARLREIGALAEPLDQPDLEAFLKFVKLMRDCGLREIECLGCRREAAPLDHFDKGTEADRRLRLRIAITMLIIRCKQ